MPYQPNADDLMPEVELDAEAKRVSTQMEQIRKLLLDPAATDGKISIGEEREALNRELSSLDVRRKQLNAAKGRRTYRRDHRTWPDLD
jgi:hypothetical protein